MALEVSHVLERELTNLSWPGAVLLRSSGSYLPEKSVHGEARGLWILLLVIWPGLAKLEYDPAFNFVCPTVIFGAKSGVISVAGFCPLVLP